MADDTIASVIALHQPKRARNGAQRVRASKPRKRQKAKPVAWPDAESPSSETLIPAGFSSADSAFAGSPDAPSPAVALPAVTPSRRSLASIFLVAAAFALAVYYQKAQEMPVVVVERQEQVRELALLQIA